MISSGVGGRPIRSNVARRISVRRSASGENDRFFSASFAKRNPSIGFRTVALDVTTGGSTRFTGWNAQNARSSSVMSTAGTSAGSGRSVGAPASIHRRSVAISASPSRLASLPCGIFPSRTSRYSRLSSGLPGTTAGPDSPPTSTTSRRRRTSSLPSLEPSSPWQWKQWALRMGRTSRSYDTGAAG